MNEHTDAAIDRHFHFSKLNDQTYRHLKYLVFWPLFLLVFALLERCITTTYHPMHCKLDDLIPFCKWFFIPYMAWSFYMAFFLLYTLKHDIPLFKNTMKFIIFTYTVSLCIFILFPTCQMLRPHGFETHGLLTRLIAIFYTMDTNTNVCPSLHVVGSLAIVFASNESTQIKRSTKIGLTALGILISISTVFMKQHSVLDVVAGTALSLLGYLLVYRLKVFTKEENRAPFTAN